MLDDYIASCYHITEFKKTYSHYLNLVEGIQNWSESELSSLKTHVYVRMPGRPKRERKRKPHDHSKAKRVSRAENVIRYMKCNGVGHNVSTYDKRNGAPLQVPLLQGQPYNSFTDHSYYHTSNYSINYCSYIVRLSSYYTSNQKY